MLREGRELQPTAKAFSLMTLLHGLGVPELFSPELTAEWEFKLAQMEHGKLKREQFMREIVKMTKHIVAQAKNFESDTIPGDFATLSARCPKCGGEVHEKYKKFQCQSCDFGMWKIVAGRQLEIPEAEALLTERQRRPARRLSQQARAPVLGELEAQRRQRSAVRFRRRDAGTARTARRPISATRNRWAPARNAARACSRCRRRTCARKRWGRTRPAISVPAAPSCSGRSRASRCKSCWRPARPICCSSCRRARAVLSRRTWCGNRTARSASNSRPARTARASRCAAAAARRRCACSASIRRTSSRSSCTRAATDPTSSTAASTRRCRTATRIDALTLDEAVALLAAKSGKRAAREAPRAPRHSRPRRHERPAKPSGQGAASGEDAAARRDAQARGLSLGPTAHHPGRLALLRRGHARAPARRGRRHRARPRSGSRRPARAGGRQRRARGQGARRSEARSGRARSPKGPI